MLRIANLPQKLNEPRDISVVVIGMGLADEQVERFLRA